MKTTKILAVSIALLFSSLSGLKGLNFGAIAPIPFPSCQLDIKEVTFKSKHRVSIFLDTNILADILDETFESLNYSINYLKESSFVTLKSSHYVIFELIEVRKREHFLRNVVDELRNKKVSISKLLSKKNNWKFDNINYNNYKDDVKQKVLEDKEKITSDFDIIWDDNILHDGLLNPTLTLCLESTISREDSLVLLSCAYPQKEKKEELVLLLSRDKGFNDSYNSQNISEVLIGCDLSMPEMLKTSSLFCDSGTQINLNGNGVHSEAEINQFWNNKIIEGIIKKNANTFLGYTYTYGSKNGSAAKCVYFKLQPNCLLNRNIGLTIIGKNLDFIYKTKIIHEFWNNTVISQYPFVEDQVANISFIPYDLNDNNEKTDFMNIELLNKLREEGNLVFINQDS